MKLNINNFSKIGIVSLLGITALFGVESNTTIDQVEVSEKLQQSVEVLGQLSTYGDLITKSFYFIAVGMLIIYILHRFTSKYLYPHMNNTRIIKVLFGTFYALILVVSVLMVLKKLGFDVSIIGKISILSVLVGSVFVFFILPFLPRLPFKIGHMVEINGTLGTVDSISTYHTTIRKFDGTIVFIPNTTVMSSKIMNYHDMPERRIEMNLEISTHSDISIAKELLLKTMSDDTRVLKDPAPSIFITNADASGIKISTYCWVENGDWLSTRSDLWILVQKAFIQNSQLSMARTQQEVYIINQKNG